MLPLLLGCVAPPAPGLDLTEDAAAPPGAWPEPRRTAPAPATTGRGEVVYLAFVRSFQDSDRDGVGDLEGLASRLDYVASLGAGTVLISPLAPAGDAWGAGPVGGAGISADYGGEPAWRAVRAAAQGAGLELRVEAPLNATGAGHPAFGAACAGAAWARDEFVFAAEGDPTRRAADGDWARCDAGLYLARAGAEFPDRAAFGALASAERAGTLSWLDGLDIDGVHVPDVDRWVDGPDGTSDREGSLALVGELAVTGPLPVTVATADDAVGVADWLDAGPVEGVAGDARRSALLAALATGDPSVLCSVLAAEAGGGALTRSWTWLEGPRTVRLPTLLPDARARRLARVLQFTLPGTAVLYQGGELDLPDATAGEGAPSMAPFPWDRGPGFGFTRGEPWSPIGALPVAGTMTEQAGDPSSPLTLVRALGDLRAATPALAAGDYEALPTYPAAAFAFLRRRSEHAVAVVANLSSEPVTPDPIALPGVWHELTGGATLLGTADGLALGPIEGWGYRILASPRDPLPSIPAQGER